MQGFNLEMTSEDISRLIPTGLNMVVEIEEVINQTSSGIIFVSTPNQVIQHNFGTVLKVGPGEKTLNGDYPPVCKEGDRVLFNNITGALIRVKEENSERFIKIISQNSIIAIVDKE